MLFRSNRAAAQNADFTLNTTGSPAARNSFVIVYLTDVGALSVAVPTGQAAPSDPPARAAGRATASIGGVNATVLFLGLTPGLVGVAQANILVPPEASPGDQTLTLSIDGQTSNEATVSVR